MQDVRADGIFKNNVHRVSFIYAKFHYAGIYLVGQLTCDSCNSLPLV